MQVDNISKLLQEVIENIDQQQSALLLDTIKILHAADIAQLIQLMSPYYRNEFVDILGENFNPEILTYLDDSVRESIIDLWAQTELSAALSKVEEQDAVEILSELDSDTRRTLLRTLKPELRILLEEGLAYPEYSAGRIMQHDFIALPKKWLVSQAIAFLQRAHAKIDSHIIFIVDENRKPIGYINFSILFMSQHEKTLADISEPLIYQAKITDTQEDICLMFKKYFIDTIPIVDHKNKLVGIILLSNIIDIVYETAQESFLQSAGVTESDFYSTIFSTLAARWKWLAVSGLHSFLSAYVTYAFLDVISKNIILTPLIPVLGAVCGTAGLQAVTVTIRALIGRELVKANTLRSIRKEAIIGLFNGIITAIIITLLLIFFMLDHASILKIGGVFGLSIFLGIIFSTVAGSAIPILLTRLNIDPAISAGPLLASFSDTVGLLIILNLAKHCLF